MYLLRLTPSLWTRSLSHRTQILFFENISLVISKLELHNGSIIVETGTGSGSLTHSLAAAVAPLGHVYTFEFHENRAKIAE